MIMLKCKLGGLCAAWLVKDVGRAVTRWSNPLHCMIPWFCDPSEVSELLLKKDSLAAAGDVKDPGSDGFVMLESVVWTILGILWQATQNGMHG